MKKRCWWSRERTAEVGAVVAVFDGVEDAGLEERGLLGSPVAVAAAAAADVREAVVTGVEVTGGGPKRSPTWFAATIGQLYSRARLLSKAPSFSSCADRVASAAGLLEDFCSAR